MMFDLWDLAQRVYGILWEWAPQVFAIIALTLAFAVTVIELIMGMKRTRIDVGAPSKRTIAPKVFIISMFKNEMEAWHSRGNGFDLLSRVIRVPGLPEKYPAVQCTADGEVCQVTTDMGLINAALTLSALLSSSEFELSKTYFLIAGVGGINPKVGTLGSVVLAQYAVQIDLQYELDSREIPADWTTGYFPQGSHSPIEPPTTFYGTEVFELNNNLRKAALEFAQNASLVDSPRVREHSKRYAGSSDGTFNKIHYSPPSVIEADVTSSNVFFHGRYLSEAFTQTCKIFTNGAANYGITAQEDNGTLAALLRGAVQNQIDFSRIILMRTASNFDQPPEGQLPEIPLHSGHGGFHLAIENIRLVGVEIVKGILAEWEDRFERGVPARNYIGDVFGTLGGTPGFGPGIQS